MPAADRSLGLAGALSRAAVPSAPPLAALKVVELRALARAAGLCHLARTGRRAELLEALGAAPY